MGTLNIDEEYGDVPVWPWGEVNGADFLTVEKHERRLLKRNHRQGNHRFRANETLAEFTTRRQAFAAIGDNP